MTTAISINRASIITATVDHFPACDRHGSFSTVVFCFDENTRVTLFFDDHAYAERLATAVTDAARLTSMQDAA